ncbi:hypothetical protein [Flavobacterium oreochromis]|uniref:Uncharacterized protein n=1 Tax=Flavobacterium columnare TaxID=996 RepID=A0A246G6X0_9FLAO|nr:hypothetical protein [Flavobacterium oreochromis]OWP73946.1 hypothetical protein BWK62_15455 [Flavobacterium oreochromis]
MAYKTIYNARGANAAFRLDVSLLEKIAILRNDANFMQKIGGDEGLQQIIKNNVRVPCKSCGNSGSKYLKDVDEYLDDVRYFVNNFSEIRDASRLINELKFGAQNTLEGGAFAVRIFKENPNGLFNAANIAEIDLRFSDDVLNRFDVKFNNGFGEFKSYQVDNVSNISVKQLKQYLSDPNLANINNLHYLFDKRKLLAQYGKGTFQNIDDAVLAVKNKFKGIFTNKTDEIFLSLNQSVKNDLGLTGLNARTKFNDLISNINSKLYNFIEVK